MKGAHTPGVGKKQSQKEPTLHWGMYQSPRAAVINYHKLGGLKGHTSVGSRFWKLEA